MRTTARETAPQIALRNFSKEAGGKVSIYQILVMGEYMQSRHIFPEVSASLMKLLQVMTNSCHHEKEFSTFLDMGQYKN